MSAPTILRVAVCLYPDVTSLDYQGPIELFGFLTPANLRRFDFFKDTPPLYAFDITFISHTLDPVTPFSGPQILPACTYDDAKDQFDIIMIPGGGDSRPEVVPASLLEFIKRQEPGAKHIFTICTGSWVLAGTGLLRGKKATSNKASFKVIKEATRGQGIDWIAKARFVINDDKKIWTSSGVTAGMDMGNAFLEFLVGKEVAKIIRGVVELTAKEAGDDDFADYYGLV